MAPDNKSLDEYELIAAVLHDVHTNCETVFNSRALKLTLQKVRSRLATEGLSFLTKTLPKLGKAFDKALSLDTPLNSIDLRFKPQDNSKLPRFLGELFNQVLEPSGLPLINPNAECVSILRQILYLFYKYELPYTDEQEQEVVARFERTEDELSSVSAQLQEIGAALPLLNANPRGKDYSWENGNVLPYAGQSLRVCDSDKCCKESVAYAPNSCATQQARCLPDSGKHCRVTVRSAALVRRARSLLSRLFARFDPTDIYPRHGPGAVATKQQLWDKYVWRNVSSRILSKYPLDAYFYASLGHFCDELRNIDSITDADLPARVILVPKDSRGPRLISCEPVDFQWIQQGLGRAIVSHVESHWLTRYNVFFTNQQPNQFGALLGSSTGRYATLDLNEASDRVTVELVNLLFPETLVEYLMACRSSSTVLPDGKVLRLNKFAPMGSCLCFPILALTVWAILTAGSPDADTREGILVYGDDVIVPTAQAENAIKQLESFGLKVNRDKSCIKGFFRESCGKDAFKGVNVTPVRLRTVWSSSRSPESYASWIEYSNSFYRKKMFNTYDYIVRLLHTVYGAIPAKSLQLGVPSLIEPPEYQRPIRYRVNHKLQKLEYHVLTIKSPVIHHSLSGWSMLLRYFAEKCGPPRSDLAENGKHPIEEASPFSVRSYTRRRTSMLVRRWR